MNSPVAPPRSRGRPPKAREDLLATREQLLRTGLEVLTEKGFSIAGLDEILRRAGVPKGSFYHYFGSKEAFGEALIAQYADYFARKLERHLANAALAPLERLRALIADLQAGMARHDFRRGCLVGNLGQEAGSLPQHFHARLEAVFADWQARVAHCLLAAREAGEIPPASDCEALAAFFWIGWEGAVMRARLGRHAAPLELFSRQFFAGLRAG